jgi:alginate O-acetyltransferase complex protein AlgI
MLLGGLWHSASWKFVAWGALHGAGLGIERALRLADWREIGKLPVWLRVFLIFQFVCIGWVLFRAESFQLAMDIFTALTQTDVQWMLLTPFVFVMMVVGAVMQFVPPHTLRVTEAACARLPLAVQGLLFGIAILGIDALGVEGVAPCIYFQF